MALIRYVNTAAPGPVHDGTTRDTGFLSLVDWYASEPATLTDNVEVVCSGGADVFTGTPGLFINKFTNLDAFYIRIQGEDDFPTGAYKGNAPFSFSHYHISYIDTGGTDYQAVRVQDGDATGTLGLIWDRMQFYMNCSRVDATTLLSASGGQRVRVWRCRFASEDRKWCIRNENSAFSKTSEVVGCVFWMGTGFFDNIADENYSGSAANGVVDWRNNTIWGNSTSGRNGVRTLTGSNYIHYVRNNVVLGQPNPNRAFSLEGDNAAGVIATHNSCQSATPPTNHGAPWFEASATITDDVVAAPNDASPENGDLVPTPTGAFAGVGTNPPPQFALDIAGNPWNTPPDIGAFQIPSAEPPAVNPYQMIV